MSVVGEKVRRYMCVCSGLGLPWVFCSFFLWRADYDPMFDPCEHKEPMLDVSELEGEHKEPMLDVSELEGEVLQHEECDVETEDHNT